MNEEGLYVDICGKLIMFTHEKLYEVTGIYCVIEGMIFDFKIINHVT